MRDADIILTYFDTWDLDQESRGYLRSQAPRYVFLLREIEKIIKRMQGEPEARPIKILDIGPAYQTELMRQRLKGVVINTLGFEDIRFRPREGEKHFQFDLNEAEDKLKQPNIERHHLVVMAEVIEHLYTAPEIILECISNWLQERGYLIIQTPNAVALRRRLNILVGRNPQEMIRPDRINPGHFREYTIKELISIARETGCSLINYSCHNYLNGTAGIRLSLYHFICNILPSAFRDDIFICLRKN